MRLTRHVIAVSLGMALAASAALAIAHASIADGYTKLLVHADAGDATTVFSDVATNKTVTANGNAQVDTAQSKFGGSAAYFDGASDYLSLPGSSDWDFGAGDFTIDFWYRKSANAPNGTWTRLIQLRDGDTYSGLSLVDARNVTGDLSLAMSSNGTSWDIMDNIDGGPVSLNTWTHIALVRSGTSIKLYVNGTETVSQASSASLAWNSAWAPVIGGQSGTNRSITGWIDEVRLSKGVARWTANFTPPTVPYTGGITFSGNVIFSGDVNVMGALSKGSGSFVIDHPLDPKNKLLYHSFVESPDVKNLYDGVATLDERGEATIRLPDYFEALNKDFRYKLFPKGEPMPDLHIKTRIARNQFTVAGGAPHGEVYWQVTGVRRDPYILANPIVTEVPKSYSAIVAQGTCIFEPLCQ